MTPSTNLPRPLTEADLPSADRILRLAFGTFLGLPDPESFAGDANYIATRWRADPSMAIGVDRDGEPVGSNFVTLWGSVGFFGPLTIRPDLWDQGIAKQLLEPICCAVRRSRRPARRPIHVRSSAKHVGLYQRFGFWPQHLTGIFARPGAKSGLPGWSKLTQATDPDGVLTACAEVTSAIYDGLDMRREIVAVSERTSARSCSSMTATVSMPSRSVTSGREVWLVPAPAISRPEQSDRDPAQPTPLADYSTPARTSPCSAAHPSSSPVPIPPGQELSDLPEIPTTVRNS